MARQSEANGQAIVEYIILITVLVLVILAIRGSMRTAVDHVYNTAVNKVNQAANNLNAM